MSLTSLNLVFLGLQLGLVICLLSLWLGDDRVLRRRAGWIAAGIAASQILHLVAQTMIQQQALNAFQSAYDWRGLLTITALHGLNTLLVGWAAGLILLWLLSRLWRMSDAGRIDQREVIALTLGSVLLGWPAVLIFLAMVFVLSVVGLLVLIGLKRRTVQSRLVIAPFIVPAAMVTLIFSPELLKLTGLMVIRV